MSKPPRCTVGDCKLGPYRWARCICGRVFAACGGPHHLHDVAAEFEAHRATCASPRATQLVGPAVKAMSPRTLRQLQERATALDLLEQALAAAARSRATIERQKLMGARWCPTCKSYHPATFRWRGRDRAWHEDPDSRMTPGQRAARARSRP